MFGIDIGVEGIGVRYHELVSLHWLQFLKIVQQVPRVYQESESEREPERAARERERESGREGERESMRGRRE